MFIGVLSEISMKAKMLRSRLEDDPDAVEEVILRLETLEEDLLKAVWEFGRADDT